MNCMIPAALRITTRGALILLFLMPAWVSVLCVIAIVSSIRKLRLLSYLSRRNAKFYTAEILQKQENDIFSLMKSKGFELKNFWALQILHGPTKTARNGRPESVCATKMIALLLTCLCLWFYGKVLFSLF